MNELDRRACLKLLGGAAAAAALLPGATASWAESFGTSAPSVGLFLELSAVLTGVPAEQLDVALALEYIGRLESQAPGVLPVLLADFAAIQREAMGDPAKLEALVDERIWNPGCAKIDLVDSDNELCDLSATPECCLARDIPLLWYTAALNVKTDLVSPSTQFVYGSAESYLGALAWKVAEAHPQAQCGGTYGYWSTEPGRPHRTSG